jgi:hypothetical protein
MKKIGEKYVYNHISSMVAAPGNEHGNRGGEIIEILGKSEPHGLPVYEVRFVTDDTVCNLSDPEIGERAPQKVPMGGELLFLMEPRNQADVGHLCYVMADLGGEIVTWMYNRSNKSYNWGHYFVPEPEESRDNMIENALADLIHRR